MAAVDLRKILRVPGRLAVNPTDMTTAWPHGGTGLGAVAGMKLLPQFSYYRVKEEAQRETQAVYWTGADPVFRALIRSPFDADGVSTFWPLSSTGTVSGEKVITLPSTSQLPGMTVPSVVLVFTPDDQYLHRGVIFRKAYPLIADTAELSFDMNDEQALLVEFAATRDSSERVLSVGILGDMSAT